MKLNHEESVRIINAVLRADYVIGAAKREFEKKGIEFGDLEKRLLIILSLAANGIFCDGVEPADGNAAECAGKKIESLFGVKL